MDLPLAAVLLLALALVQRALELAWSARCVRRARASTSASDPGDGAGAWSAMVAVHVALFVLPLGEVLWLHARAPAWLLASALVLWVIAGGLRVWAIAAIGARWNVRAEVFPALGVCTRGPYRWIRHPNYLAVLIEFSALPLALGAWRSWILLNALHALVLAGRIRREEKALGLSAAWRAAFANKGRFFPRHGTSGLAGIVPREDTSRASPPPLGPSNQEHP